MISHARVGAILLALCSAGAALSAFAYVPPSEFLIEETAKKRSTLKTARIKTRITGTKNQIKETAWYDAATREIRATIQDAQDHSLYQYSKTLTPEQDAVAIVLFSGDPTVLAGALRRQAVPVLAESELLKVESEADRRALERTSLGKFENKIAWVIGQSTSSLWLLKDEFVPFRFFFSDDGEREIRLEEIRTVRDFPYARAITLFSDGEYVLKGQAIEVSVNPSDASGFAEAPPAGMPPLPEGLDEPTSQLIRDWIKWLR